MAKKVFKGIGLALAVLATAAGALLAICIFGRVPLSYDRQRLTSITAQTVAYDATGVPLTLTGRAPYTGEPLSEEITRVFVAAEDQRFYEHAGVDVVRTLGAVVANFKSGEKTQGGSTITQQLVKNRLLSSEKTYLRKAVEAIFALQVEQDFSKEEILAMYLGCVYFGKGAYGLEAAAWTYFTKTPNELTLVETAALAASLKAPSTYAPHLSPQKNASRRAMILNIMAEEGMITVQEAESAKVAPLALAGEDESKLAAADWYFDAALAQASALLDLPQSELRAGGYRIHTYLQSAEQRALNLLARRDALFAPNAADGTPAQCAVAVVQVGTGQVTALLGGRAYDAEQILRATEMRRQPGSALKPIAVYAPALERRFVTAATILLDEPTDFGGYVPRNYNNVYKGEVTLRQAVTLSLNVPAVKLLQQMTPAAGVETMRRFGLDADAQDAGLALAVGSMRYGVSPLSLCAAYAALGNGGVYNEPALVAAVYDARGNLLYKAQSKPTQALDPAAAFVTTNLLSSVATTGTAKTLAALPFPVAAKTGTVGLGGESKLNRDAWCAAYTDQRAVCVWMGFDRSDESHALPASVTGGTLPAQLARECLSALNATVPFGEFVQPDGVLWANAAAPWEEPRWEVFLTGTQPIPPPTPTPTPWQDPIQTEEDPDWEWWQGEEGSAQPQEDAPQGETAAPDADDPSAEVPWWRFLW